MRLLVITTALLLGCEPGEEVDCHHEPELTWENHGASFTRTYCRACHSTLINEDQRNGSPEDLNVDSYESVLRWLDTIQARVDEIEDTDAPTMPPAGGPTPEEYAAFREFLQCKASEDREQYYEERE